MNTVHEPARETPVRYSADLSAAEVAAESGVQPRHADVKEIQRRLLDQGAELRMQGRMS